MSQCDGGHGVPRLLAPGSLGQSHSAQPRAYSRIVMATGRRTSRCVIKNAAKPIDIRARAHPPRLLSGHVNTFSNEIIAGRRRRRKHSAEFKAQVVAACVQPGVSIAATAMSNGVNANLVPRWVIASEAGKLGDSAQIASTQMAAGMAPLAFVPLRLQLQPTDRDLAPADIRIELRRSATAITSCRNGQGDGVISKSAAPTPAQSCVVVSYRDEMNSARPIFCRQDLCFTLNQAGPNARAASASAIRRHEMNSPWPTI